MGAFEPAVPIGWSMSPADGASDSEPITPGSRACGAPPRADEPPRGAPPPESMP